MSREGSEVEQLKSWVSRRLGLVLDGTRTGDLSDLLRERTRGKGVRDYLDRLEHSPEERRFLAERLTVGETYFFRHADHFKVVEQVVLPSWLARNHGERELRILSAGCASGEEIYSLAYCTKAVRASLLGIDVNPAALRKAALGAYTPWSLRDTSEEIRRRLFRPSGREFILDEAIRSSVVFEERNLVDEDPSFWSPGRFDLIFCRNVLMYFSAATMREVVARLSRSLAPGGYLFLGPAETLRGISQDFHLRHTHDTFYYQTPGLDEPTVSLPSEPDLQTPWMERISEATKRIAGLAAATEARDLEPARELFRQERYDDAIAALEMLPTNRGTTVEALLLRAVLLTNRERMHEASAVCEAILRVDELNAGAHYLMALSFEREGRGEQAVERDQTAAYLDATFAMPHLHLGLMARRAGDLELSRTELGRALALFATEDPSRVLLFGGGFSREALMQLCLSEIASLEGPIGGGPLGA